MSRFRTQGREEAYLISPPTFPQTLLVQGGPPDLVPPKFGLPLPPASWGRSLSDSQKRVLGLVASLGQRGPHAIDVNPVVRAQVKPVLRTSHAQLAPSQYSDVPTSHGRAV